MGFSVNPLSLNVPDSAFESWRQVSGFVDLLVHRTSADKPATAVENVGCFASLLTQLVAVFSLLTINPLSKLEADDFAKDTSRWTTVFFGDCDSYSLPSSSQEARTRVHENVNRFARNYATLFIVFFTCALYQMPLALLGFVSSLVLWELFKFCSCRWEFHRHRLFSLILIRFVQCATASLLAFLNVQMAIFYALAISYAVVILHGRLRNLSLSEKPS